LSVTWSNLFKLKDNNIENNSSFELLRRFHCADCLKSFQSKMNNNNNNHDNSIYQFFQQQQQNNDEDDDDVNGFISKISQDSLQLNLPKTKECN
jgi:hypothetical protein